MHAWAEKQQENNESETRKAYPDLSGKKELRKGVHADNSLIQRQLFIRTTGNPVVVKSDSEMTTEVKASTFPNGSKVKSPQYVHNDTGYTEIFDTVAGELMNGYIAWLQNENISFPPEVLNATMEKIKSMICKTVTAAPSNTVFPADLHPVRPQTRLAGGEAFDVAYYFDSLEEFYKYLYISAAFKENKNPQQNDDVKINVVTTGAGDAIVMTLSRGYLIVDLGTNLDILLNYLALRANKRKAPDTEQTDEGNSSGTVPRGIPLNGEETCIVITHNHIDHRGGMRYAKAGTLDRQIESVIGDSIIGSADYQSRGTENAALIKLHAFLESGNFQIYTFPQTNPQPASDLQLRPQINSDSLVIARRNEREAIILSGDQEPKFLVPVIESMTQDSSNHLLLPAAHAFIKVPHHGSSENNTLQVFNSLSRLSLSTDFVISSGKRYEHPTSGAFTNRFNLYAQGTQIQYPSSLSSVANKQDIPDTPSVNTRTGRVFYTADLSLTPTKIEMGSVGHKSIGEKSATYSKRYTQSRVRVPINLQDSETAPQTETQYQKIQTQAALNMISFFCNNLPAHAPKDAIITVDAITAENLPLFMQQNKAQLPSLIGPEGNPSFLELFYNNLQEFVANNWNSIPALFSDIFFVIHPEIQAFLLGCLNTISSIELWIHFLENLDVAAMYEAEPNIREALTDIIIKIFINNTTFERFSNNFYYNAVSILTAKNLEDILSFYLDNYNESAVDENADDEGAHNNKKLADLIQDILNVISVSEEENKSNLCIGAIEVCGSMHLPDTADILSCASRSPEQFFKLVPELSDEPNVQLEYIISCILKNVVRPEDIDNNNLISIINALVNSDSPDYITLSRLVVQYPAITNLLQAHFPEIINIAGEQDLPISLQIINFVTNPKTGGNFTMHDILESLNIDFAAFIANTPLMYLQVPQITADLFNYAKENADDLSAMISVYYQYHLMQWVEMLLSETYNLIPDIDACMDFFHSLLSDSNMPLEVMNHCFQIIVSQNNFTELLENHNLLESMIHYFPELLARWMLKQNDNIRYCWADGNLDLMIIFYEKILETDAALAAALFYQQLNCLPPDNAYQIYLYMRNANQDCIFRLMNNMGRSFALETLQRLNSQDPIQELAVLGFDVQDLVVQE